MLNTIGDIGFLVSALMLGLFTVLFLVSVRWWSDVLGRLIAGVFLVILIVMTLASIKLLNVPLPGIQWWRAFLYGGLAVLMVCGNVAFVWSQFFARRLRRVRSNSTNEGSSREGIQ